MGQVEGERRLAAGLRVGGRIGHDRSVGARYGDQIAWRRHDLVDLLAAARRGRRAAPVFIVGDARSGTSVLFRTLLQHPAFRPRVLHLVESFVVQRLYEHATIARGAAPELEEFLLDDEAHVTAFLDGLAATRPWRALTVPLARRRPRSVLAFRLSLGPMVLRAYVDHAIAAQGCRRLVEKTPHNVPFAPHLLAAFPAARLLFLTRHPLDTFTSYRRRSRSDPDAAWARIDVDEFCIRYAANVDAALAHQHRWPASFRVVSYERFTSEPAMVAAELCAFVGEQFEASMLEGPGDFGAYAPDPYLYSAIVPTTKAWQEWIGVDEAVRVERRLAPQMAALGYEPRPYRMSPGA